jgi:hypothetical protein
LKTDDRSSSVPLTPKIELRPSTTGYGIIVAGHKWYESTPAPRVCTGGVNAQLVQIERSASSGSDLVGEWTGTTISFGRMPADLMGGATSDALVEHTLKHYTAVPSAAVLTTRYLQSIDTSGKCQQKTSDKYPGTENSVVAEALALNTSFESGARLQVMSWGHHLDLKATRQGLGSLPIDSILDGPVVSVDPVAGKTLVWSTLDSHKIVPQQSSGGVYSMGLSAGFQRIEAGFSHSILLTASDGGPTAAMYEWGATIQAAHGSKKVADQTLSHIGYFTDDGAYYYQWQPFPGKQPGTFVNATRAWPAEVGLVKVKEALYARGVPIAYMQLGEPLEQQLLEPRSLPL